MITAGCFVNYQLNHFCYCDYKGVFLWENWGQKDFENKGRKSTQIWYEKNSSDKYTQGNNYYKMMESLKMHHCREDQKVGQRGRNVCMAKQQQVLAAGVDCGSEAKTLFTCHRKGLWDQI